MQMPVSSEIMDSAGAVGMQKDATRKTWRAIDLRDSFN